jgi:hypothetical protein
MTFAEFEARASEDWERIPDAFKEGIEALVIARDAKKHDRSPDIYTLGECKTESWPSDYGGPDTIRSELVLYYGSFRRLATLDEGFDWEAEIWETLTHELKHHLESLAAEDDLEGIDAAMEQHFRRRDGEPFDPFYYRAGESLGDDWYRLEHSYFLEVRPDFEAAIELEWDNVRYRLDVNADEAADVTMIDVTGVDAPPAELCVVIPANRTLAQRLQSVVRRRRPNVTQLEARAHRVS